MGRPLKIKKTTTVDIAYPTFDDRDSPVLPAGGALNANQYLGVVGGDDGVATAAYPVVKVRVFITGAGAEADGWIIRQKGSTKYLVTDGTNTGVCILANEAEGALTEGNMNIAITADDSSEVLIARLTNKFAIDYSNNRYLVNFFSDEGTEILSGTAQLTIDLGIVENYTS